jgi:hypothetical protein
MKAVCEALGVARSNMAAGLKAPIEKPLKGVGRAPAPDDDLVAAIKAVIGDQPTYGYRRVWAMLRRAAVSEGRPPVNHKRVHRVMKAHSMLLRRHAGGAEQRRHDGRIAVDRSNLRWCSDGFELACDNGEKVRVAFALDCCDREAMAFVATTEGIKGEDVRDLMVASVESRFGQDQSLAPNHRMAQRQWIRLYRQGNESLRPRDRPRAANDARHKPAVQRHGRSLRPHDQTRLRPRQSHAGRQHGPQKPAAMVRPLQRRSPAQRPALSFATTVHRRAFKQGNRWMLGGHNRTHGVVADPVNDVPSAFRIRRNAAERSPDVAPGRAAVVQTLPSCARIVAHSRR